MPDNSVNRYIGGGEKLVGGILRIFLPRESSEVISGGLADIARTATGQEIDTVLSDGRIAKLPPTSQAGGVPTVSADGRTVYQTPSAEVKG